MVRDRSLDEYATGKERVGSATDFATHAEKLQLSLARRGPLFRPVDGEPEATLTLEAGEVAGFGEVGQGHRGSLSY